MKWLSSFFLCAFLALPLSAQTLNFGPEAMLNSYGESDNIDDSFPDIAMDASGVGVAVWSGLNHAYGFQTVRTTDSGKTWAEASQLSVPSDYGFHHAPRIATDDLGNWMVVWSSYNRNGGFTGIDGEIFCSLTSDGGLTWSAPNPILSGAANDTAWDTFPTICWDGAGEWIVGWFSDNSLGGTIGTDDDILLARSPDNGATWSDPIPLSTEAATDSITIEDELEMATDGAGHWVAVWFIDYDVYFARSSDNAMTWSAPAPLNSLYYSNTPIIDFAPDVATDGAGQWIAVWAGSQQASDGSIYFAHSQDNGATWSATASIIAENSVFKRGSAPSILADHDGNWIVTWQDFENLNGLAHDDFLILASHSADFGSSWSDPEILNDDIEFMPDPVYFPRLYNPRLATDNAGNWLAVWHTGDTSNGSIEGDIFYATSNSVGRHNAVRTGWWLLME